jgi:hypothetical protein
VEAVANDDNAKGVGERRDSAVLPVGNPEQHGNPDRSTGRREVRMKRTKKTGGERRKREGGRGREQERGEAQRESGVCRRSRASKQRVRDGFLGRFNYER